MPRRSNTSAFPSPTVVGTIPAAIPPTDEARARFARRREAARLAELMAAAVGRSTREAGTARLALRLAKGPETPAQKDSGEERSQIVVTPHGRNTLAVLDSVLSRTSD